MWALIKMLGVAAAAGAGVGVFAKSKLDSAINGDKPKKVKRSNVQIIEIPADLIVEDVKILARRQEPLPAEESAE